MKHVALVLVLALSQTACVSTAAIAKPNRVSLPVLFGAVAADFFVSSLLAFEVQDYSVAGSLATATAVTAADGTVGCILGGCSALRP